MLTYAELMAHLKPMNRNQVVALANAAGVVEHTLIKVWNGTTKNPSVLLVEAVSAQLEKDAA